MATYYVKNGGNDGLDGLSDGNAWANLSQVNGFAFASGDIIRLGMGSIWRETLTAPRSNLTINSYVTGSSGNPQILGSKIATTWTDQGSNIWKSDIAFTDPRASGDLCDILFNKATIISFGLYKANTGSLTTEYDWTWSGNYIYVYSTTNPASAYTWVEIPQRRFGIDLNGKEYLSFSNIDFQYQVFNCIYGAPAAKTDVTVDSCNFSYIGGSITSDPNNTGYGIQVCYSNMLIKNSEFHHCGRRAISLDIYGSGFTATNCIIEDNYFHDGYHTTGVDIKSGSGYTGAWDGIIIRRNTFYDPTDSPRTAYGGSEAIWIEYGTGGSLQNIFIYSNIFKNTQTGHAFVHTQGIDSTHGVSGLYIYNNTFYEHATPTTGTTAMIWLHWALNVKIKNNIFYSTKADDSNFSAIMIYCYGGAQDYTQVDCNYNLYWTTNSSARIIVANGSSYNKTQFSTWKSALGWDANSPTPASPNFVSGFDLRLQVGSPAITTGVNVSVALDYNSYAFANPPSIGAYEYGSSPASDYIKRGILYVRQGASWVQRPLYANVSGFAKKPTYIMIGGVWQEIKSS